VSATLIGGAELNKRLKAISAITAPTGNASFARHWQEATVRAAKPMIPRRTGETRNSIRPGRIRGGNATVVGKYTVNFIDAGSKAHVEPRQFSKFTPTGRISKRKRGSGKVLKFEVGGQAIFRKKVNKPRIAARPFKKEAGRKGLQAANWFELIYSLWNAAA
jgi:hypothetical protein